MYVRVYVCATVSVYGLMCECSCEVHVSYILCERVYNHRVSMYVYRCVSHRRPYRPIYTAVNI